MILYSIIIPVYNVEKYLRECLESIINQSYKNWEAIVVDDGSNDEYSSRICDEYAKKDERIKVYHKQNEGLLLTLRYGLRKAKGDYFLFADSDDYVHKEWIATINEIVERTDSDLVMYRFKRVGGLANNSSAIVFKEGTIFGEQGLPKELVWKKVISGCSLNNIWLKAVKRNLFDWDIDYAQYAHVKSGTDMMQSLPIFANAKKIYFSEKVLYYYRFNPNSISTLKGKKTTKDNVENQLKIRRTIYDREVEYLQKCGLDSEENLKLLYKRCFESHMELLIAWMANESDKDKRYWIMKTVFKSKSLEEGKKYLQLNDFSGDSKVLYHMFLNNGSSDKVGGQLLLLAKKNRIISVMRECMYKIKRVGK